MIGMYCRRHHGGKPLCEDCRELDAFAQRKTLRCPFGENKPSCAKCRIHCYKPQMKTKIREVMKYSGPRMMYSHPILAVRHFINSGRRFREQ
jgi:hypothetical protein